MDATATRDRSRRAVRAAVQVAADHGLPVREAVVLRDGSNLTVALQPAAVVARVSTTTSAVRDGDAWLTRELAVAEHLVAAGAPVVSPSRELPPGPHDHDGLVLSFWELAPRVDEPADPGAAGEALRICHEALADFPGELPELGALEEARSLVDWLSAEERIGNEDAALLVEVGDRVVARIDALDLPMRPLHGDSHLRNVINTTRGALWADWEDTFAGPLEWDLACLAARAFVLGTGEDRGTVALDAYGADVDEAILDLFVEARTMQAAVWGVVISRARAGRGGGNTRARLRWLRARAAQPPRS
jgi:Phosphotransferase enzyme family